MTGRQDPQRRLEGKRVGKTNPAFLVFRAGARGQGTLEYAALIVIVAAALLSMAVYLKRGLSGQLRGGADTAGQQYDPRATTSNLTLSVDSTITTTSTLVRDQVVDAQGTVANVMTSTSTVDETTNRTGTENVGAMGTDIWQ